MKITLSILILILSISQIFSQDLSKTDSVSTKVEKQKINHRHSIGSSLFMLGNFSADPPDFYQLSYGYRLTKKDNIIVEAITWKYSEPLGTYGHSDEFYPGKVKAYGVGLGYQRFHWKNLYTTIEPTFFLQQFYDTDNTKIQKGFQLYLQVILGYRFEFFKKRIFIEPAYALKYWPVNTNFPEDFAAIEKGTPKYTFEPSLNFGFKF
ncbi:hypothetical protein ACFLSE_06800 [Bacteroidota bacterium]